MENINFEDLQKINDKLKNIKNFSININYNDLYLTSKLYLTSNVAINILTIYLVISLIDFWLFFRIGLLYVIYKYRTRNCNKITYILSSESVGCGPVTTT